MSKNVRKNVKCKILGAINSTENGCKPERSVAVHRSERKFLSKNTSRNLQVCKEKKL